MSDAVVAPAPVSPKAAKKSKATTKPKVPAAHPKYSEMIVAAIKALKERGGSSRQAIAKYITSNFKVGNDEKKINAHLRLAIKKGVSSKSLVQVKGSFKIGEEAKVAKKIVKKAVKAAKPKTAKKATSPKKTVKKAAKKAEAAPAAAATTETAAPAAPAPAAKPAKAKKAAKPKKAASPKKAKAPKIKKAASPKKAAAKKPKAAKKAPAAKPAAA